MPLEFCAQLTTAQNVRYEMKSHFGEQGTCIYGGGEGRTAAASRWVFQFDLHNRGKKYYRLATPVVKSDYVSL